jgi:hypothetical protein
MGGFLYRRLPTRELRQCTDRPVGNHITVAAARWMDRLAQQGHTEASMHMQPSDLQSIHTSTTVDRDLDPQPLDGHLALDLPVEELFRAGGRDGF